MNSNSLDITFDYILNVSKAVVIWNYWDHEHLDVIHDGYESSDIMYDRDDFLFRVDTIKVPIPFFPFVKLTTPVFMVQHDANTLFTFAVQLGIVSKTTITTKELDVDKCTVKIRYQFELKGWQIVLKPILKKLIPRWNKKVSEEDMPMKLRRQKVLRYNFKDFIGLPKNIEDRVNHEPISIDLPVQRRKNSSRDKHPFSLKNKLNLKN
jgi:hypothetical protein